MSLNEYLEKENISITAFAKKIGYTRQTVAAIISKSRVASKAICVVIELVTDGQVTAQDLHG